MKYGYVVYQFKRTRKDSARDRFFHFGDLSSFSGIYSKLSLAKKDCSENPKLSKWEKLDKNCYVDWSAKLMIHRNWVV